MLTGEKYKLFGDRLATHLQRLYRGRCGRAQAQLRAFQRYHYAAFVIQRAYREHVEWHEIITHTVLRKLQGSSHLSRDLKKNKMKDDAGISASSPSRALSEDKPIDVRSSIEKGYANMIPQAIPGATSVNFKKCLKNKASFDEKMSVWRAIIELRRGHRAMGVDVCMKALLESNGDISRAMVLMGDSTYALKNEGSLPLHLRTLFMPFLRDEDYLPEEEQKPELILTMSIETNESFGGAGLAGIRTCLWAISLCP